MKFQVTFEGGRELAKALDQLSTRVKGRVVREVLKDAAEPMRARMAQLAPKGDAAAPNLSNVVVATARNVGSVDGGKWQKTSDTQHAVAVGPSKDAFYGVMQEYGTVYHGAQPFARPAFDSEALKALQAISRGLWVELAARGIGRFGSSDTPLDDFGASGSAGLGAGSRTTRGGTGL
jgi:HK97 gp10 family phage protein